MVRSLYWCHLVAWMQEDYDNTYYVLYLWYVEEDVNKVGDI